MAYPVQIGPFLSPTNSLICSVPSNGDVPNLSDIDTHSLASMAEFLANTTFPAGPQPTDMVLSFENGTLYLNTGEGDWDTDDQQDYVDALSVAIDSDTSPEVIGLYSTAFSPLGWMPTGDYSVLLLPCAAAGDLDSGTGTTEPERWCTTVARLEAALRSYVAAGTFACDSFSWLDLLPGADTGPPNSILAIYGGSSPAEIAALVALLTADLPNVDASMHG